MEKGAGESEWPRVESVTQKLFRKDLALSTPFEAPRTETERRLASIWEEVLGVSPVGVVDDFFEFGGDSFAATSLAAEIEATFGMRFAPSDIIDASTIGKQAEAIAGKTESPAPPLPSVLIAGSTTGSKAPVFMVHGGSGFAFLKPAFVEVVGDDRPVYFFQAPGLDGRATPLNKVEDIARLYVGSMREVQPTGPYNIAAMCAGAFIALEMCNQIEEAGERVGRLVLLDPNSNPPAQKKKWAKSETKLKEATALSRIPPEKRTHVTESMIKVVQELHEAVRNYVPRPYSGQAAMLVNSNKVHNVIGDATFWQSHLGGIEHQVFEANHQELFHAKLPETAWFLRNALEA